MLDYAIHTKNYKEFEETLNQFPQFDMPIKQFKAKLKAWLKLIESVDQWGEPIKRTQKYLKDHHYAHSNRCVVIYMPFIPNMAEDRIVYALYKGWILKECVEDTAFEKIDWDRIGAAVVGDGKSIGFEVCLKHEYADE